MTVYNLYLIINGDQPLIIVDKKLERIVFEGTSNYIPSEYMKRLINHLGIGYNRSRSPILTIEIL